MEIGTSGVRSDVASWRDFWEIGVALNGMCIRDGRQGFQINIGNPIRSHHCLEWLSDMSNRCRWWSPYGVEKQLEPRRLTQLFLGLM